MKVLVRSLLGLVCDAQEADDEKGLSQLSGKWRTVYIASTSPEKIAEDGPFRAYLCYLVFDDEQGTVDFYFYVNSLPLSTWEARLIIWVPERSVTSAVYSYFESESHSVVSDSLGPHGLNSPGQNTGVGSLSLLQGIFPTQGSNPGYSSHLIFGEKQRKSQLYVNFFIILINHPEYGYLFD
ncbi:hypothetical protein FD755_018608 [Muntiacus reevesi]|uniref:Lipocalin/cytosolic fatty-acid binding domain-containing protein n=1 Tax=Muntiacus reevesi TaxID=9886 RepID=A0A5N3X7C2_MUNRE|nr:hypothetical protein FD755_018608 [Muntiacus reevesi]